MSDGGAVLVLADGTLFRGEPFGALGEAAGEVVFNTGMTGYQEVLTDPSYHGQIVCMTAPEIGNVGTNGLDQESAKPWVAGFVVRSASPRASSYRSEEPLQAYLRRHGIVAIREVDTRALTLHIRETGAQMGIIAPASAELGELKRRARALPGMAGRDLAREVSCKAAYAWTEGEKFAAAPAAAGRARPFKVVAYDFGIKQNILRLLVDAGCEVQVVPATTSAEDVLAGRPDGVFLSNGPGDPASCTYAIAAVRAMLGKVPVFGICLGHQIMGLALGGRTYKLKFGHRGLNHPVKELASGKVLVTTQNHGFAVDPASLEGKAVVTHRSLNDDCVEGLRHVDPAMAAFSVQYHPEASAGPHDARGHFAEFTGLMRARSA